MNVIKTEKRISYYFPYGMILDVEASMTNHASEVATTETMIERIEENHDILPNKLTADTAYGAAKNLNYLVAEKKSSRTFLSGTNRHAKTTPCATMILFLSKRIINIFAPKESLSTIGNATSKKGVIYRSRNLECVGCPLKKMLPHYTEQKNNTQCL